MSTYSLQKIIDRSKGRIDLSPLDTFISNSPVKALEREIELYGNGAHLDRTIGVKKQSAPQFVARNVSGYIDLDVFGHKDPAEGYEHQREGHAGFWLGGCTDLWIRSNVRNVPGDFVYMGSLKGGKQNSASFWVKPCNRIVLDVNGFDAGRHALAPVGVGTWKPNGDEPDDGKGLTILETSSFKRWQLAKIDIEFMGGQKTHWTDIDDRGAYWSKR